MDNQKAISKLNKLAQQLKKTHKTKIERNAQAVILKIGKKEPQLICKKCGWWCSSANLGRRFGQKVCPSCKTPRIHSERPKTRYFQK